MFIKIGSSLGVYCDVNWSFKESRHMPTTRIFAVVDLRERLANCMRIQKDEVVIDQT